MKLDVTRLMASRPAKHFNNCKVSDIDPLSKSSIPREVEVILPDADGSKVLAMWHGEQAVAVDDYVRVRRDTSDSIYTIEGYGGSSGLASGGKIYQLWESDGDAVAWAVDADGNLEDQQGRTTVAEWYDYSLLDSADLSGIASHFRDNDTSYPAGWTEVDAPNYTDTNDIYSFWRVQGTSAETNWKYRIQSSLTLESIAANRYISFLLGPIFWRDASYTADLHWRFGMYRDNAGSIDENTYIRVDIYWNSGSSIWQIRGEEQDGSTPHASSYVTLDQAPLRPLWLRVNVQNGAAKRTRAYYGSVQAALGQQLLLSQSPSSAPTWGQVWVQIEMTRGAGLGDMFYMGGIDYMDTA